MSQAVAYEEGGWWWWWPLVSGCRWVSKRQVSRCLQHPELVQAPECHEHLATSIQQHVHTATLWLLGGKLSQCLGVRWFSHARTVLGDSKFVPAWASQHRGQERVAEG